MALDMKKYYSFSVYFAVTDNHIPINVDSHHTTFIFLFIALLVLGMIGCNVLADIISYKGDKGSE